jgi:hypothetical protein
MAINNQSKSQDIADYINSQNNPNLKKVLLKKISNSNGNEEFTPDNSKPLSVTAVDFKNLRFILDSIKKTSQINGEFNIENVLAEDPQWVSLLVSSIYGEKEDKETLGKSLYSMAAAIDVLKDRFFDLRKLDFKKISISSEKSKKYSFVPGIAINGVIPKESDRKFFAKNAENSAAGVLQYSDTMAIENAKKAAVYFEANLKDEYKEEFYVKRFLYSINPLVISAWERNLNTYKNNQDKKNFSLTDLKVFSRGKEITIKQIPLSMNSYPFVIMPIGAGPGNPCQEPSMNYDSRFFIDEILFIDMIIGIANKIKNLENIRISNQSLQTAEEEKTEETVKNTFFPFWYLYWSYFVGDSVSKHLIAMDLEYSALKNLSISEGKENIFVDRRKETQWNYYIPNVKSGTVVQTATNIKNSNDLVFVDNYLLNSKFYNNYPFTAIRSANNNQKQFLTEEEYLNKYYEQYSPWKEKYQKGFKLTKIYNSTNRQHYWLMATSVEECIQGLKEEIVKKYNESYQDTKNKNWESISSNQMYSHLLNIKVSENSFSVLKTKDFDSEIIHYYTYIKPQQVKICTKTISEIDYDQNEYEKHFMNFAMLYSAMIGFGYTSFLPQQQDSDMSSNSFLSGRILNNRFYNVYDPETEDQTIKTIYNNRNLFLFNTNKNNRYFLKKPTK